MWNNEESFLSFYLSIKVSSIFSILIISMAVQISIGAVFLSLFIPLSISAKESELQARLRIVQNAFKVRTFQEILFVDDKIKNDSGKE